jgi:serine/threonine protein kinase
MSSSVAEPLSVTPAEPDRLAPADAAPAAPSESSPPASDAAPAATAPASGMKLVGQQVGKYRVLREIGRGGMGAVFEAVHESIGQRIAIKVLNEEYSSDARHVQRFFDEARAVNIVQHPSLVKIYDFGQLPGVSSSGSGNEGTAYITMEFLSGESLQDRLNRLKNQSSRMMLQDALRIARQIGSALEAVHEKGIAHRDLKPANLFLVPDREAPGGERVKILDFGIAKFFGAAEVQSESSRHLTTVGKLLGTPVYMSPEQCSGAEQIDDRVDVYALGVIVYQLLSNKLPFEAPAACVIMTKHIMEPPPPLHEIEPQLPPAVCTLVEEMLAKKPKERPSMAQVVLRLEQFLESQLGLSSAEWRSVHRTRLRKARRWPLFAAIAGFVLMSATLIAVGKYRRAQRSAVAAAQTASTTRPAALSAAAPPAASAGAPATPALVAPPSPSVTPPVAVAAKATPPTAEPPAPASRPRRPRAARSKSAPGDNPGASGDSRPAAPSSSGGEIPILR